MTIDFSGMHIDGRVIAVALSGGSDSMALFHYMTNNAEALKIKVAAINVEHGIRGEESVRDSEFVEKYCSEKNIPLFSYKINAPDFAEKNKLSLEQAARILRYRCFFDAVKDGKCNLVATAHHASDNLESVLFNIFRGTGLKGVAGIRKNYRDIIIRPLLKTRKEEIDEYVKKFNIPYVTDKTNFDSDYTRNFLRLKIIPLIKEIFPEADKAVSRLTELAEEDDLYIENQAKKIINFAEGRAEISIPADKPVFGRAAVMAMKSLGMEKDWEKIHTDDAYNLSFNNTGKIINLPCGITAVKEYDKIVFYKNIENSDLCEIPFKEGNFEFFGKTYRITRVSIKDINLKDGLYIDCDKIKSGAVIRRKKEGDVFTKFGGGTKLLSDFFTDKKIPRFKRDKIPLIADGKEILAVFGLAISDKAKADKNTKFLYKIN